MVFSYSQIDNLIEQKKQNEGGREQSSRADLSAKIERSGPDSLRPIYLIYCFDDYFCVLFLVARAGARARAR